MGNVVCRPSLDDSNEPTLGWGSYFYTEVA